MARNEFVKARVSPEEKEIYQQLCEQAGCTEAELIRSVLIHREISLDDLDDEMQVLGRKKKALHKQQENYRRAQASRETDESGEPISEKRSIPFQVMLTAPEKKAIEQRAEALGMSFLPGAVTQKRFATVMPVPCQIMVRTMFVLPVRRERTLFSSRLLKAVALANRAIRMSSIK